MISFIGMFLNLFLILVICFQPPSEKIKFFNSEQTNKEKSIDSLNLLIFFMVLVSLWINILLNLK